MNSYNSMIPESIDLNCKAISARTSPFTLLFDRPLLFKWSLGQKYYEKNS